MQHPAFSYSHTAPPMGVYSATDSVTHSDSVATSCALARPAIAPQTSAVA
jgi:hypothetical protein